LKDGGQGREYRKYIFNEDLKGELKAEVKELCFIIYPHRRRSQRRIEGEFQFV